MDRMRLVSDGGMYILTLMFALARQCQKNAGT